MRISWGSVEGRGEKVDQRRPWMDTSCSYELPHDKFCLLSDPDLSYAHQKIKGSKLEDSSGFPDIQNRACVEHIFPRNVLLMPSILLVRKEEILEKGILS
ncbi:hypothetical protein ABFS82_05G084800 [Erythranthe guttata]